MKAKIAELRSAPFSLSHGVLSIKSPPTEEQQGWSYLPMNDLHRATGEDASLQNENRVTIRFKGIDVYYNPPFTPQKAQQHRHAFGRR